VFVEAPSLTERWLGFLTPLPPRLVSPFELNAGMVA
jgi:hypothetical protein